MLKLTDLRKTTRRSTSGDARIVHPHLLRDRALAPRIELAIRYLDSMVGRPRRELESDVPLQLFGDYKVARCVIACLSGVYRHRPRAFAEVLPAQPLAALAAQGITNPSELRLWLYQRVNTTLPGFAGGAERAPLLEASGAAYNLTLPQLETLFTLDTPANAILTRIGPMPSADDVIARFNYETLAAYLANATLVRLSLSRPPKDPDAIRQLCALLGVRATLTGRECILHGQQDALESWARHGAKLARLLSLLLICGLPARSGEATIAAPTGDEWRLRLDNETLGYLGQPHPTDATTYDTPTLLSALRAADAFTTAVAALRRTGALPGWRLRRSVSPLVTAEGIAPELFSCQRESQRVSLILAPTTAPTHHPHIAERYPMLAFAPHQYPATATPPTTALRLQCAADPATLPALLEATIQRAEHHADTSRLTAACDDVRRTGMLSEARLAKRLACDEDALTQRLTQPPASLTIQQRGLRYIEGFGLCTADILARAQAAAADLSPMRADPQVGRAWILRTLGRRLREVTGASEGIECLIAYLGAA